MILVDTSALYALLSATDDSHAAAASRWEELLGNGETLVTHNYVVHESVVLVQRRLGLGAVHSLIEALLPPVRLRMVDEALHRTALSALLAARRREMSLTDWTSFELMRREGIDTAFAFDDHFRRQGFAVLP